MLVIISHVITYVAGVVTAIVVYEYQRWRARSEAKKQAINSLKSEISRFINEWKNFKETSEMQVGLHLKEFKEHRLREAADSMQDLALRLKEEGVITKDVHDRILEASNKIRDLSAKKFYVNGGKSWNEFISSGDDICRELEDIEEGIKC